MNAGRNEAPASPLPEPLTRREQEVLTLLAEGLTAGEMADRLTLAVSSVRWFAHQIYGKLGVSGKRQAVSRARELGLLRSKASDRASLPGLTSPGARPKPTILLDSVKIQAAPRHNLPVQRTPLVGRAQEVQKVQELLAQGSLVTLTGSGGVGKTRLSLQAAETVLERFADGVWFVELAALSKPELVPQQVAESLAVREVPGQPILKTLTAFLKDRQVLLVLDNCEHLRDACCELVNALLGVCAGLKVLTSSREPLGIAGEVTYRVPSLLFPAPGQAFSPEDAVEFAAVRLFVIQARLALPGFEVTAKNAAALARICQRLDGIPLAIELAAARAGLLTLEEIASRLDDAFHLLTGGSRSALPRQQTLRATIDWSYRLLDVGERRLFRRLAVFAGGCTLEAAEAVCGGEGLEGGAVFDRLASLVAKSMVMVDFPKETDATRYRLMETVRQYAVEKLLESGESPDLHKRHRDYILDFMESNVPKIASGERLAWTQKLEAEHDNLRLALDWSFAGQVDLEAGLRLIVIADNFWDLRNFVEPIVWFNRAAAVCAGHPEISMALYADFLGKGSHRMAIDNKEIAVAWGRQGVEIGRRLGPNGQEVLFQGLMHHIWNLIDLEGYPSALAPFAEAEAVLEQLGPENHSRYRAWLTNIGAKLSIEQGKYQQAIAYGLESNQLCEKLGFGENLWNIFFIGDGYTGLGDYDQARRYYQQAMRQADEYGDLRKGVIYLQIGNTYFLEGDLAKGLSCCQQGLIEAYAIPDYNVIAFNLDLAARILARQGRREEAARLSGAAHTRYERQSRLFQEKSALDVILPEWEARPEREAIRQAFEQGRVMSVERVVELVLNL